MIRRILIVTGSHLCHNPRVIKEATALQQAGFDVEVLGGWFDANLKQRDQELLAKIGFRYRPVFDLTEQMMLRFGLRARSRIAKEFHDKIGLESHWQLGYFVSALGKAVLRSKADLVIAHSEQALFAVSQLQKSETGNRRFKVGVDMEDWFSEDLPEETRRHRPIKLLKNLERGILNGAAHASCPSRVMSEALASEYDCRPPIVIYNAFSWSERSTIDGQFHDRKNRNVPSIHWFSQTLGTDRGLADLFAALPYLKSEAEIHLRGKMIPGFEEWLATRVPENWRNRIFIHGLVSNGELLSRIAEHDIGFAGEQKSVSRSRDLTVTNKILQYLLGGLAVVASDTAGQREIADNAEHAVRIYPADSGEGLAAKLNELLGNGVALQTAKNAALQAAEKYFCWEKQSLVLLESVQQTLFRDG